MSSNPGHSVGVVEVVVASRKQLRISDWLERRENEVVIDVGSRSLIAEYAHGVVISFLWDQQHSAAVATRRRVNLKKVRLWIHIPIPMMEEDSLNQKKSVKCDLSLLFI